MEDVEAENAAAAQRSLTAHERAEARVARVKAAADAKAAEAEHRRQSLQALFAALDFAGQGLLAPKDVEPLQEAASPAAEDFVARVKAEAGRGGGIGRGELMAAGELLPGDRGEFDAVLDPLLEAPHTPPPVAHPDCMNA